MKKGITNKPNKNKTNVAIIIDRSGSMDCIRRETVDSFNEQVKQLKDESKNLSFTITLSTFGTQHNEPVFMGADIDELEEWKYEDYVPSGMTAMLDGVGNTITKMRENIKDIDDDDVSNLIIIISDGLENNSKEFTYENNKLQKLITELQDTGRWTFTYLGANQDLSKISEELNIPIGNITRFDSTKEGMDIGTHSLVSSISSYSSSRAKGMTQTKSFYDEDKEGGQG